MISGSLSDRGSRIRRIKCDEEKPACLKCTSTGRKCDVYEQPPAWKKPDTNEPSVTTEGALTTLSPASLPSGNPCERLALEFFQVRTISQLSGYFESDLWNRYVLQLSLLEPSLYYATTALGSLHLWYTTGKSSHSVDVPAFTFQQYNKAIHYLLRPAKPLSTVVILVACYIFSCFEGLYGNYASAFRHVASGIKLLSKTIEDIPQTYSTDKSTSCVSSEEEQIVDKLLYHFSRLDLQAATFDSAWTPRTINQESMLKLPSTFSSLEQARLLLNVLLLRIMEFKRSEASGGDSEGEGAAQIAMVRQKLQHDSVQWSNAFERWLAETSGSLDRHHISGSRLLKVHFLAGNIMLSVPEGAKETTFDQFLPHFQSIVSEVSHLVSSPPAEPHMELQRYFSNELGIIPALYLTGAKCRDPGVRRKAQALLTSSQRREGVWNSLLAAKVVDRIIAIEEGETVVRGYGDISEPARVFDIGIHISSPEDRDVLAVFARRPENDHNRETIEVKISW
jgi:Fungal Zn(2)-Cys(6) binuclear cluster domain